MTLWLLGQHQPEMRVVGEGIVAWKERMPGLVYLDVALVPDSPISVAFSSDNRQIVSGSRDKTIKLWNTLGVCKYTVQVK